MEFCNLIGANLPEYFERKLGKTAGIPLRISANNACNEYGGVSSNVWVQSTGDEVVIKYADEGGKGSVLENNLFAMGSKLNDYVLPLVKRRGQYVAESKTIWADVQDTEENPAIIVICKALHLVNGVRTYIKALNVNSEYIVAMLVCGAIGFEDGDGEVLYMSRNLEEGISVDRRSSRRLSPEKFNDMLMLTDSNGYKYNMDMLVSAYVYFGSDMVNVRVMRDACVVFDPQADVRAKAIADAVAEKARQEEERKAKEASEAEERRIKQEQEAAHQREIERIREEAQREASRKRAREKASETRAAKKAEKEAQSEITTAEGSDRNAGAELFLSMLGKV